MRGCLGSVLRTCASSARRASWDGSEEILSAHWSVVFQPTNEEHPGRRPDAENPFHLERIAKDGLFARLERVDFVRRRGLVGRGRVVQEDVDPCVDVVGSIDRGRVGREREDLRHARADGVVHRAGVEVALRREAPIDVLHTLAGGAPVNAKYASAPRLKRSDWGERARGFSRSSGAW